MILKIVSPKYGVKEVLIDDEDSDKIKGYTWVINKGYKVNIYYCDSLVYHDGRRDHIRMHRLIMDAKPGYEVDHINRNGLDNRKSNLRLCTQMQNQQNQKIRKDNTSGYKGVSWNKLSKRWIASIRVNKRKLYLGSFVNIKDAHKAYCEASKKYHGEFGRIK